MEQLQLAQYFDNWSLSQDEKNELLNKVDVNYCIPDTLPGKEKIRKWAGYTSLHFVVKKNDLNIANELLKKGADPTKQGIEDKFTPLHIAIDRKSVDNKFGHLQTSVYQRSGRLQEDSFVSALLSKQVEINNAFNPKCKNGITHLHIACIVNHAKAVEFFVKARVDFNQQINNHAQYLPGYTALHCAIKYSSVEAVDVLLQFGADIHFKNTEGMTCVHLLLVRLMELTDMIKMGKRKFCLPYLEEIDRLESIIKLVLKIRLNGEKFLDQTGLSALHLACSLKDKSLAEDFLKQKGVDVNMPTNSESKFWQGWTPIHFAAYFSIETVILLIQNGANVMVKNLKGETALDLCTKRFTAADVQSIISMVNAFKDITLSDNSIKLLDVLLAMNDYEKFSEFLQKLKDFNIVIPFDSPIWPGFNLLHLSVSLNQKTELWEDFEKNFDLSKTLCTPLECYNCTEDEEALFNKRLELCLKNGCNVDMKNALGQTPIHLAFDRHSKGYLALKRLLKSSEENIVDQSSLSHLHIACALGLIDSVKKYLNSGADVDCRTRINFDWPYKRDEILHRNIIHVKTIRAYSTPLHIATVFGYKDIIEYLLKNNADVYAQDSQGFTSIHLTMYTYIPTSKSIAQLLFNATPDLQDRLSAIGLSHLHVAAWMGDKEVINKLLLNGADIEQIIDASVKKCPYVGTLAGKTPLLVAVISCNRNISVKSLLKKDANVYAKDVEGVSALQRVIYTVYYEAIQDLIDTIKSGRCEVELYGMTQLHVACGNCDIEWATQLLEDGADVNARIREGNFKGATPIMTFLKQIVEIGLDKLFEERYNLIPLLVKNGADVTIDCDGDTPLHLIYQYHSDCIFDGLIDNDMTELLDCADLLLANLSIFDVNPKDRYGFTHFHLACVCNDVETVKKFLYYGVDVNLRTDPFAKYNGGFTPLHFAMAHKSSEVAYLLLERGANVNAENTEGDKPLHVALKRQFVDFQLFKAMIKFGADVLAKNLNGETLLYCIIGYDSLTLERLEFFLDCGCSINVLNATNIYNQGIIGLAIHNAPPIELQSILKRLTQLSEVKSAIQKGFNAIHSIVAVYYSDIENHEMTNDNFLSAIELFINMGSNLDELDSKGRTALHTAVSFGNQKAVNALLLLGADVNATDNKNESPFLKTNIMTTDNYRWPRNVIESLARHVWKMTFVGLYVKESNVKCLRKAETEISFVASLEQSCQDELRKARETEICQGLTVNDFLSELGAIAQYPRMFPIQRDIVDKFFKCTNDLRQEFPEFSGLLAFQYRKALAKMKLWQPAKEVIALICPIELPDLCLEVVMRFLTNSDMELLVQNAANLI